MDKIEKGGYYVIDINGILDDVITRYLIKVNAIHEDGAVGYFMPMTQYDGVDSLNEFVGGKRPTSGFFKFMDIFSCRKVSPAEAQSILINN